jgi:hypothetical protein
MVATTIVEPYGTFEILGLLIYGVKALLIILVIYVLILVIYVLILTIKALKKYLNS